MRFVELDQLVEKRAGLSLGEIFSLHGEDYYRTIERQALTDLLAGRSSLVIAVGSGLVTSPETYALLLQKTTTVWLKARADDYWTRVIRQGDRRPIDQHPQARQALRDLIARREASTRASASVDTSGLTAAQVVERVNALPVRLALVFQPEFEPCPRFRERPYVRRDHSRRVRVVLLAGLAILLSPLVAHLAARQGQGGGGANPRPLINLPTDPALQGFRWRNIGPVGQVPASTTTRSMRRIRTPTSSGTP
jgi:shikimate kinase